MADDVTVTRNDEARRYEIHVGDELRTGPFGKVTLVIPGGSQLSARSDAVIRFTENGPVASKLTTPPRPSELGAPGGAAGS